MVRAFVVPGEPMRVQAMGHSPLSLLDVLRPNL